MHPPPVHVTHSHHARRTAPATAAAGLRLGAAPGRGASAARCGVPRHGARQLRGGQLQSGCGLISRELIGCAPTAQGCV